MTDEMVRPARLEGIVVVYGEHKVSSDLFAEPVRLISEGIVGGFTRQFWVWMVGDFNHNITVDRFDYNDRVVVRIRSGAGFNVEVEMFCEPSDEFMETLLDLVQFTSTPVVAHV